MHSRVHAFLTHPPAASVGLRRLSALCKRAHCVVFSPQKIIRGPSPHFSRHWKLRCHALHGLCDRNSVRLTVRLSHSWTVSTWFDLRS